MYVCVHVRVCVHVCVCVCVRVTRGGSCGSADDEQAIDQWQGRVQGDQHVRGSPVLHPGYSEVQCGHGWWVDTVSGIGIEEGKSRIRKELEEDRSHNNTNININTHNRQTRAAISINDRAKLR